MHTAIASLDLDQAGDPAMSNMRLDAPLVIFHAF
jgi:hypothetical protein